MTTLAIHAVDAEQSVVVGNDGSLWRVATSAETLISAAGSDTLESIAGRIRVVGQPTIGATDLLVTSATEALRTVRTKRNSDGTTAVVWPFAGTWYRTDGSDYPILSEAIECLRSTISDARLAAALVESPHTRTNRPGNAAAMTADAREVINYPPPGQLQRWEGDEWVCHSVTPAPVVDPVTGILHRITYRPPAPPLPAGFIHAHAELPHLGSIDPHYHPDPLAPSGALTGRGPNSTEDRRSSDSEAAQEAAILSGVAHYCGAYLGQGARRFASLDELRSADEHAIDIADWEPHDPQLHDAPGFPFVLMPPDQRMWWLQGRSGTASYWVPMSLVHAGWMQADLPDQVPTNFHNLAGLHAGRTFDEAVERACSHVVAHDAIAVWWASGRPLPGCAIPDLAQQAWTGSRLDLSMLAVPSTTGAHVRLAVVDDRDDNIISLGFAAHARTERAEELAIVEALIQHASARDLASETSLIRNAEEIGNGGAAGLLPFDRHRHYADGFGPIFRGLIDPMCHLQYGLDPRVVKQTRDRIAPGTEHPGADASDTRVLDLTRAAGHLVVTVDVTTERVRTAGYRAARVIVPGMARIQPAAFPLNPRARLTQASHALRWSGPTKIAPYPGW